jgi:cell division protein FtsZ
MTSPLLDAPLNEASGVLVNIVGGKSLSLQEIDKVIRIVDANVNDGANVIVGARLNCEDLADDAVSVTIIATSFKKGLITRYIRDYVTEAPA